MTLFVRAIIRNSFQNNLWIPGTVRNIHVTQVPYLYSSSSLGIDTYLNTRKRTREQFEGFLDRFKTKMTEFIHDPKNLVFSDDLKNMAHLAEPTDLELVLQMVKKFNSQNTEYRFNTFVFGPVVMRMFYFLDAPQEALQCFFDPVNKGFFDQLVSFQLLLDLLYNNEMYEDMFKVYSYVQERQINMSKYPKYPTVLIFAACYKQNSPASLEFASRLWSEMSAAGVQVLRRTSTLFAALALKQGAPHIALESVDVQKKHYITIRNIRAVALAQVGRLEDSLMTMRSVLDIDIPEQKDRHTVFQETIDAVAKCVEQSGKKDVQKQFADIVEALRDRKLIDEKTLDQHLTHEIDIKKKNPTIRQQPNLPRMPFYQRRRNP